MEHACGIFYYSFVQASCNDHLGWYKNVKENQASVEVTAKGQMDNIFLYGCYIVGSSKSRICQSYHDVIHLLLNDKDQSLTKRNFNLEELRDLESKLVLITGSKAENRLQVDTFIDVSFWNGISAWLSWCPFVTTIRVEI